MLIIGLTGGIGAGKSTVSNIFAELGVPIIDADKIAYKLTKQNPEVIRDIVQHFGKSILDEHEEINRKALRQYIFNNVQERCWLESLLHPLIKTEIMHQLSALKAPYAIVVIPLLVETGPYTFIDRILTIETEVQTQIQRVALRDQSNEEEIQNILEAQASASQRIANAHDIIWNNKGLTEIKAEVLKYHALYSILSAQSTH